MTQNEDTILYDSNRRPFHVIRGVESRNYVTLDKVSINLQKAVVGIEDGRFFKHPGFDLLRIFGAIANLFRKDSYLQGASTITQQLVKLSLLTQERTLSRKIKELFMSIAIEMEFSKAQILEFYLNIVYLGRGNYGVENASKNYFGKLSKDLNIAEAAFIAGLIKKPEGYSPFTNLEKARKRQVLVLKRLAKLRWITLAEFSEAIKYPIQISQNKVSELNFAPYFTNHIILDLVKKYGHKQVYGGGLRIYTTLDRTHQEQMEKVVRKRAARYRTFSEMAGVSIDPATGFVKALVGGIDFDDSEFNRATQAQRQPGSSFKPIVYATALTKGIRLNDVFEDEPTVYERELDGELEIYSPENYTNENLGKITVAHALRVSNNVVTVKILKKIGIPSLKKMAEKFGLEIPDRKGLCLALGCSEVSLLDLTSAYAVFANAGKKNDPVFILKVMDNQKRILEEYIPINEDVVLSEDVAFQMNRLLQDVVDFGTGRKAKIKRTSGGKTGTTNQHRDAWYIGYTPELVTGFWIGNDDNKSMRYEVGGATPARLWKDYMNGLPSPPIRKSFAVNEKFDEYKICLHSGLKAGPWCQNTSWLALPLNHAPEEFCDIHTGEEIEARVCRISGQLATPDCPQDQVENKRFLLGTEPITLCEIHAGANHGPGEHMGAGYEATKDSE